MIRIIKIQSMDGPNIFCYRPVVRLTVDLGAAAGRHTRDLEGFNEKLLTLLPSLRSHYCSRGYPGGLVERLLEGTYPGHVLEHIILELLHRCGMKAGYGKTITGNSPCKADIIFEYSGFRPSISVARSAVRLVNALLDGREPILDDLCKKIDLLRQRYEPGPSTAAIIDEARRRNIPVTLLEEGKSLLLLGYGKKQRRMQATLTSAAGCLAADLAGDKAVAKTILARGGIPTPRGEVVFTPGEAQEAALRLGGAVAVKPCDANQGKGVSLNLTGAAEIEKAFLLASGYSRRVLVEEYITGRHYRLLVVGGRFVAAARRLPAQVKGDGRHSVAQLVELANRDPQRGMGHARPLTKIQLDEEAKEALARQGKSECSRPAAGEIVLLRENANLSTGGTAWDVTFKVHPANAALAERAAALIGLDVAGIDLVTPDLKEPVEPQRGAVIEVNAAPGIRMHLYPSRGRGCNVAAPIVDLMFPGGDDGRIPIISITGTNGKTTTARLLAHILEQTGKTVGLTTTEGVYIGGRLVFQGDTTGPKSARMVLDDPSVEAAVLETARGGIIRGGLGFDRSDAAVITNVSADHLGQDGLDSVDGLVFVKSLLVETVHPGGAVVLNADDAKTLKMIPRAAAPLVLFALQEDNLTLRRHLAAGGRGITVRAGSLFWICGPRWHKLIEIARIPIAFNGLALHQLQNAMAAAAAALAVQTPWQAVVRGLAGFTPSAEHNPGRGNFYRLQRGFAFLDYGHNPAAFDATLQFISRLGFNRLVGVVGVPGDRSGDLIRQCGRACAPYLDEVIFKEDRDLRGRRPGETAGLLVEGYRAANPPGKYSIILDEVAAVEHGLSLLDQDDLLVVFYEERAPLDRLFQERLQHAGTGGTNRLIPNKSRILSGASGGKGRAVNGEKGSKVKLA